MLRLLCLSVLFAGSYAMVCMPEICASSKCAAVTAENCEGRIKANGGFCGCCDACITQLAAGDSCSTMFMFGIPATVECAEGLHCDAATHICMKTIQARDLGLCAQRLAEVNARLEASNHMLLGLEKPHCDANGDYLGMQFSGSQAYCVTKDGTMISGYMVNRWETGDNMTCQCARDQYAYMQTGLIGKLFFCEANGNYKADGTSVSAKRELAPCAMKLAEVNAQLASSEHPLLGLEKPHCDSAGYYQGIQFSGSQAYCVTKNGTMIDSYMLNRWEVSADTSCQCARDLYDYMQTGLIGKLFYCNPDGSYPKTATTNV